MNNNNIITYLQFRGDLTFRQSPCNDVDYLILSSLITFDYSDYLPDDTPRLLSDIVRERTEKIAEAPDGLKGNREILFTLAGESKRFGNIKVTNYSKIINEEEYKTFYAVTLILSPFKMFVAYRGTDGSLLSWKENFKTIYTYPTAGQTEAANYLNDLMKKHPLTKFIIAGHSKGANLAVYAAMNIDEKCKKRLTDVYSFDGPGFMNDISETPEYISIKDKIRSFIPESCVIGKLMNPPYENTVVASSAKGVYQHDSYSWQVLSTGFDTVEATDSFSDSLSSKVNDWIYGIPVEEREKVVEEFFGVFVRNNITHINSLLHLDLITTLGIVRSMVTLSSENKKILMIILKEIRN